VTVGHNPPVSGVLALRTWVSGPRYLALRTSINGHCSLLLLLPPCFYNASVAAFGSQDLGFRTSLACVSPPPPPAEAGSAIENAETGSGIELSCQNALSDGRTDART
jgi:hypothetical protein